MSPPPQPTAGKARFGPAYRIRIPLLIALCLCPLAARAQDVTTVIPQGVLNDYLAAVGPVAGSGTYSASMNLPSLRISPRSAREAGQGSVAECVVLANSRWAWNVNGPRFEVKSGGITFQAFLSTRMGKSTYARQIEIPVSVRFDSGAPALELTLADTDIPVFLNLAGQARRVGGVNVSPYYGTRVPLSPALLQLPGRVVTGSLKNVDVALFDGGLRITGDLDFTANNP